MTVQTARHKLVLKKSSIVTQVALYEGILLTSRIKPICKAVEEAKAKVGPAAEALLQTLVQLEQDALAFRALKDEPPAPRRREAILATKLKRARDEIV